MLVGGKKRPGFDAEGRFSSSGPEGEVGHSRFSFDSGGPDVAERDTYCVQQCTQNSRSRSFEVAPELTFVSPIAFAYLWEAYENRAVEEIALRGQILDRIEENRTLGIEESFFVVGVKLPSC